MLIINDLHIGVTRQGGTTPQSQQALRDYVRSNLYHLLETTKEDHVVVNGDLFDNFTVDVSEVIKTYELFSDWLHDTNGRLTLIMGNHDASAKADKVSSFHLLCHFLLARFGAQVQVIDHTDGFTRINEQCYAISHCMNQELFNLEINKAVQSNPKGRHLLLHANYKNTFAENSDHSLNLNDEQIGALMRAGWVIVLAHEHKGYELRGGRVVVVGNQIPTSVADCIDEKAKRALIVDEDGYRFVETWRADGSYIEVDWRDMNIGDADFVRVVGEASAAEAADVISAISKLRQQVDAFVITNAVKIAGNEAMADMAEVSLENVKAYDVIAAIMEQLDEREAEVVKGLIHAE